MRWWDVVVSPNGLGAVVLDLACPFQVRQLSYVARTKARAIWDPKAEGTASGWLHRAAKTSLS
ncbi:hypothetical protein C4D60_Mb09t05150 [Musa balbisiana]|uniref:Uncharacterized protein n=1 Tax=Musa balbisiana TaxID=52838 RepID=A0A4V4H306_MUSBA|nr:hypothetical protein C4D60_Mb09t05150 [Musa balbisiana]